MKSTSKLALLGSSLCLLTACEPLTGESNTLGHGIVTKITAETYLNGDQFCSRYSNITNREHSKDVMVLKDYSSPLKGQIKLYTWTPKPFDPRKPTVIVVNGGPGQNSHDDKAQGNFGLENDYNEINFDQRGLGCSAPATFDEYKDPSLYSTANTVRDMERIRRAYGISSWAVYGISYGTVPATQYASQYQNATRSLVLEGVVGRTDKLHRWSYKAEKANLMIQDLSMNDRASLNTFIKEGSADSRFLLQLMFGPLFMLDGGLSFGRKLVNQIFVNGEVNPQGLEELRKLKGRLSGDAYTHPQYPGAVDDNILTIIYCKELNYRTKDLKTLGYTAYSGFYETSNSSSTNAQECSDLGVTIQMEKAYSPKSYPVDRPVYYFQGSHDGATMAEGAHAHWTEVPKNKSFFMLAQKGGHNPGLSRLDESTPALRAAQQTLLQKSFNGALLTDSDLIATNLLSEAGRKWILFTSPNQSDFNEELAGIKNTRSSPSH